MSSEYLVARISRSRANVTARPREVSCVNWSLDVAFLEWRRGSQLMLRNVVKAQGLGMFSKGKVKFILEQATKTQTYSSNLSLTSALDRGAWSTQSPPPPLYLQERPGTHCIVGWVGCRADLKGCGKSRPHGDSIPGPSSL